MPHSTNEPTKGHRVLRVRLPLAFLAVAGAALLMRCSQSEGKRCEGQDEEARWHRELVSLYLKGDIKNVAAFAALLGGSSPPPEIARWLDNEMRRVETADGSRDAGVQPLQPMMDASNGQDDIANVAAPPAP